MLAKTFRLRCAASNSGRLMPVYTRAGTDMGAYNSLTDGVAVGERDPRDK